MLIAALRHFLFGALRDVGGLGRPAASMPFEILGQVAAAKTAHCAGIPCGILHGKFPERIFSFLNKLDEDSLLLRSLKF